jgi:ABC-2 type transport system ATP-binding protein
MKIMDILHVTNLTKRFSEHVAVDNISLTVGAGEIYGFLGPNGAGKTTTIKMLAGLLQPDSGSITINSNRLDENPAACKKDTGYIPDRPWLYEKLTGMEFLQFIASLYELDPRKFADSAMHYLKLFDLDNWQDHLVESYSHGMRQKLIMTSVFMQNQPLMIIDEPMVGLDPKSARLVKELFKQRAEKGTTIFLSTHSLEIAEELCHHIGIISEGKILTSGPIESLRAEAGKNDSDLEDIFLELTGAWEMQEIISALRDTE